MTAQKPESPGPSERGRQLLFLLVFGGVYVAQYLAYAALPDRILRDWVYHYMIVVPCQAILSLLVPGDHVVGLGNELASSAARLAIVRGCDAAGFLFLLVAAIVASRSTLGRKCVGTLSSVALVYVLNLVRIVALYLSAAHHPKWFVPLHVYALPTFILMCCGIFFALWAGTSDEPSSRPAH